MKILVIDDDSAMTDLLNLMLAPTEAKVLTANSGDSGVQQLRTHNPDVVILDLIMISLALLIATASKVEPA